MANTSMMPSACFITQSKQVVDGVDKIGFSKAPIILPHDLSCSKAPEMMHDGLRSMVHVCWW